MLRKLVYVVICYAAWLTYADVSAYFAEPTPADMAQQDIAQITTLDSDYIRVTSEREYL